jgi:hypothetical protein
MARRLSLAMVLGIGMPTRNLFPATVTVSNTMAAANHLRAISDPGDIRWTTFTVKNREG